MATVHDLPRYDIRQSYAWNYDHAPSPVDVEVPPMPGTWDYCGLPVDSPLGIPAGPLLNGRWVLYYASLGFDVLTYKTVRRIERACYPLPNLLPVRCGQLTGGEAALEEDDRMEGSWAVSFGMPSREPEVWMADVRATRDRLPPGKLLAVSVVATVEDGTSLDAMADDYATCARQAVESGADVIETNFSCPNVSTCDGQLYQQPAAAARVAERVAAAIGSVPYVIKIGHVANGRQAEEMIDAFAPYAAALAMTNSVATTVADSEGRLQFEGQPRGICGTGIRDASLRQTEMFAQAIADRGASLRLVGVGGAATADDVRRYLDAGAHAVQMATAAMIDPGVALAVRREW